MCVVLVLLSSPLTPPTTPPSSEDAASRGTAAATPPSKTIARVERCSSGGRRRIQDASNVSSETRGPGCERAGVSNSQTEQKKTTGILPGPNYKNIKNNGRHFPDRIYHGNNPEHSEFSASINKNRYTPTPDYRSPQISLRI